MVVKLKFVRPQAWKDGRIVDDSEATSAEGEKTNKERERREEDERKE